MYMLTLRHIPLKGIPHFDQLIMVGRRPILSLRNWEILIRTSKTFYIHDLTCVFHKITERTYCTSKHEIRSEKCSDIRQHTIKSVLTFPNNDQT